ncbi:MAG: DUF402 domain-containing protein [Pyrinomonadaceae bacterium]
MEQPTVIINSRKYDGEIHKSWKVRLKSETESVLTFVGAFASEVKHPSLGVIRRGTVSYEFYWKNEWFNIFRFHEPEGELRNFYCNISLPPIFSDGILDYIDLDIDVLVWKDFSHQILDTNEFDDHAAKYGYTVEMIEKVNSTLKMVISMIERKVFPFDYKF